MTDLRNYFCHPCSCLAFILVTTSQQIYIETTAHAERGSCSVLVDDSRKAALVSSLSPNAEHGITVTGRTEVLKLEQQSYITVSCCKKETFGSTCSLLVQGITYLQLVATLLQLIDHKIVFIKTLIVQYSCILYFIVIMEARYQVFCTNHFCVVLE